MRGLATRPEPPVWGGLAAFERLDPHSTAPLAVAVSGGGDSLAALIHACAWAKAAGRRVLALSVDHGLQEASADWCVFAGEAAARLGAGFQTLTWTGGKPATGLPAAARAARHALLAEAARAAGASIIVTGHTADDRAENAALGQGVLCEWSPSPAWPEGREVFLLRPLLDQRRADIRCDLIGDGWDWIEDPANSDLRYARARLRTPSPSMGAGRGEGVRTARAEEVSVGAQRRFSGKVPGSTLIPGPSPIEGEGSLRLHRDLSARSLAAAAVCAGGGLKTPRGAEVARLMARIAAGETFTATLCGSRIEVGETVLFTRELGRAPPPPMALTPGQPVVWDGRYELLTDCPGLTIEPLAGHAAKLDRAQSAALRQMEARARPGLPLVRGMERTPFCPLLAVDNAVRARSLVTGRYRAACDLIASERQGVTSDAWRTAFERPMFGPEFERQTE